MATETKTISLVDFINDCPARKAAIGFYVSVGVPTGQEILLGDPDYATPIDDDLGSLDGTVDRDGWHWDGEGHPNDFRRNTIVRLEARYGSLREANRLRDADG